MRLVIRIHQPVIPFGSNNIITKRLSLRRLQFPPINKSVYLFLRICSRRRLYDVEPVKNEFLTDSICSAVNEPIAAASGLFAMFGKLSLIAEITNA